MTLYEVTLTSITGRTWPVATFASQDMALQFAANANRQFDGYGLYAVRTIQ